MDTLADAKAGGKNTAITLTRGGTGNFGGSPCNESWFNHQGKYGAAEFTIGKANFNVFDGNSAPYTYSQDGYQIVQGEELLAHGDHSHYSAGWADLSDSAGAAIEVWSTR